MKVLSLSKPFSFYLDLSNMPINELIENIVDVKLALKELTDECSALEEIVESSKDASSTYKKCLSGKLLFGNS